MIIMCTNCKLNVRLFDKYIKKSNTSLHLMFVSQSKTVLLLTTAQGLFATHMYVGTAVAVHVC